MKPAIKIVHIGKYLNYCFYKDTSNASVQEIKFVIMVKFSEFLEYNVLHLSK